MANCHFCEKETFTPSHTVYGANTTSSSWQSGPRIGTTTEYKDIIPLSFAICKDCAESQKTVKTRAKKRLGFSIGAVGLVALLIAMIFGTATQGGICLPMGVIIVITFSWGGGLLAMIPRIKSTFDIAVHGKSLSDDDLFYVFHSDLVGLARKNNRNTAFSSSHYSRLKIHSH